MATLLEDPQQYADVGKSLALVILGASSVYAAFISWWRKNRVDAAKTTLDVESVQGYGAQLKGLQEDIARLRDEREAADKQWRDAMAQLEDRLKAMDDQVDVLLQRARTAEDSVAKLRRQVIGLGAEPVV